MRAKLALRPILNRGLAVRWQLIGNPTSLVTPLVEKNWRSALLAKQNRECE